MNIDISQLLEYETTNSTASIEETLFIPDGANMNNFQILHCALIREIEVMENKLFNLSNNNACNLNMYREITHTLNELYNSLHSIDNI